MSVSVSVSGCVFVVNVFMERGLIPCCPIMSNPLFFIESDGSFFFLKAL